MSSPIPHQPNSPQTTGTSSPEGGLALPDRALPEIATKPGFWGGFRRLTTADYSGSQRGLSALNRTLEKSWNESDPAGWLITRVRCEILKLPPREYALQAGLVTLSTLRGLERGRCRGHGSAYNPHTMSSLLKEWSAFAARAADPSVVGAIAEAKQELLKLITPAHLKGVYRVLGQLRVELGPDEFERRSGINYKTMWARSKNDQMFKPGELIDLARRLGVVDERMTPLELRSHPKMQELINGWLEGCAMRGRPHVVSQLHVLLSIAGMPLDRQTLGRATSSKLQTYTIIDLSHYNLVPWKKVAGVFDTLVGKGILQAAEVAAIRDDWKAAWSARPATFEDKLVRLAEKRGIRTRDMADALELRKPTVFKPVLPVFRALKYAEASTAAPSGVLAALVARNRHELSRLLDQKRGEIRAAWRREGSLVTSPVAVERHLWSIGIEELPFPKRDVQRLEWGLSTPLTDEQVLAEISKIAEERSAHAVRRLKQQSSFETISDTFKTLIGKQSQTKLAVALKSSQGMIGSIAAGDEVPNLPRLREFLDAAGVPLSSSLRASWHEEKAKLLMTTHVSALERVLEAHLAAHASTKTEMFGGRPADKIEVSRDLSRISDTGVLLPRALPGVLRLFAIKPSSELGRFVKLVAEEGAIEGAIRRWLKSHPETEPVRARLESWASRSIPSDFVGPGKPPMFTLEEELTVVTNLPGATAGEIRAALRDETLNDGPLLSSHISRINKVGISITDVLFAVRSNVDSYRPSAIHIAAGIRRCIVSPILAPGITAYLAGRDEAGCKQLIESARQSIEQSLTRCNVTPTPVTVGMRLWGIRGEDLGMPRQSLVAALKGSDEQATQIALSQIEFLAQQKLERTLLRLYTRKTALTPHRIAAVARESIAGGDRALTKEVRLSFGAPTRFVTGKESPTLMTLTGMAMAASIPTNAHLEREWFLACGDRLAAERKLPIVRAIQAHIGAQVGMSEKDATASDSQAPVQDTGGGTILAGDSTLDAFIQARNLPRREVRAALREAESSAELSPVRLTLLGRALDLGPTSLAASFMKECNGHEDAIEPIVSWWRANKDKPGVRDGFSQLVRNVSLIQPLIEDDGLRVEGETIAARFSNLMRIKAAAHKPLPQVTEAEEEVMHALAGVSRAELLKAAEQVKALEEQERARGLREQEARTWRVTPSMVALPFDRRIEIVADRAKRGFELSIGDLLALLPERRSTLSGIHGSLMPETSWYVGALSFFSQPLDALTTMQRELQQGRQPRNDGRTHFSLLEKWVQERGSLGKLTEGSLRLFFKDVLDLSRPDARRNG